MMLSLGTAFFSGAFTWTFMEYALHHWVFHIGRERTEGGREHLQHHISPDYFAAPLKKTAFAVPILGTIGVLASFATSLPVGMTFALGITLGWLGYEILHQRIHLKAPLNAYGRWARRNHLHHHFASTRKNHGVTSPLWDVVFGTYQPAPMVKIPKRHAAKFPWLLAEGETQKVAPSVASDFVVV